MQIETAVALTSSPSSVLARLERAVRSAEGFRLCLVGCDDPGLQEKCAAQLADRLRGKRMLRLRLEAPVESLAAALEGRVRAGGPGVVSIQGLEPTSDLRQLPELLPTAVVLWLSRETLAQFQQHFPDATVYHIPMPPLLNGAIGHASPGSPPEIPPLSSPETLSDEEKDSEIRTRRQLLDRVSEAKDRALLQYQIGLLYLSAREWADAATSLEQAAAVYQQLDDEPRRAAALLHLGHARLAQDLREDALGLYRLAAGLKAPLWVEAELRYRLALLDPVPHRIAAHLERCAALRRQLDDPSGLAAALHRLADLRRLPEVAAEAVKIRRDLGDLAGLAASLELLGSVERSAGRWKAAMECFQESLALREQLADREAAAVVLAQIGRVHDLNGAVAPALEHYATSWHTLDHLDSTAAPAVLGLLRALHALLGDDRFRQLLEARLAPLAARLTLALQRADAGQPRAL